MLEYKTNQDSADSVRRILNPVVEKWFFSKFKEFSLPQRAAVLDIHCRKNILVSAPTGATKTLTAFLAILNELVDSAIKGFLQDKIYAVYVSPLKALNNDIQKNLLEPLEEIEKIYGKSLGIRVAVRTGDTTTSERTKMLKKPPHILITTPESLGIILASPKFRDHLRAVDWFIADEIHALAENKRGVHLSMSMERLQHLSSHMARIGLSATVAPLDNVAMYLVGSKRDCTIVDADFTKKMDLKVISPLPDLINTSQQEIHDKLYSTLHSLIKEHKTTLIFTNTRAATERVVDNLKDTYPKHYGENIGAHHGSLSAEHRTLLESRLRAGEMKAVACSTSLELGIDIGYIDLVITIGSPKSVARALQRIGRSGHNLDAITKGRIIVLDRDDLVECSVLLKAAMERKIDRIHIPQNALDVLAQHIYGMAIEEVWDEDELYKVIKKSYCYKNLKRKDYDELLSYLAGEFASLEDRYVYAKIWRKDNKIGKKGKMARVIYMTNIGTIPDQTGVQVKIGNMTIGTIDESFLERLRPGDIFVLGGNRYLFKYSRGMTAQVQSSVDRPPTVPSWVSEMLPLSFDLAEEIGRFRKLMEDKFLHKKTKNDMMDFIDSYLHVDKNAAEAIYMYFYEQFNYLDIPNHKKILIEHYIDADKTKKTVFHTLYGRRVNDVMARAIAFAITKSQKKEVEIGLNDNGFYLAGKDINVQRAMKLIKSAELYNLMKNAIEGSEILKRRFRHCAGRALMILRSYMGKKKNVGRQQMSSMLLLSAVKRISDNFPILEEARREVLEDQMDIGNARQVFEGIESGSIKLIERQTTIPSPFSFNIVMQGVMDIIKIEDKIQFLQRMHQLVLAKISLEKGKKKESINDADRFIESAKRFDYHEQWIEEEEAMLQKKEEEKEELRLLVLNLKKVPVYAKDELLNLIEGDKKIREDVVNELKKKQSLIKKAWPKKLGNFVLERIAEI